MRYYVPQLALWKDQAVILICGPLGSIVEFDGGFTYLSCELGPISDFEIIGDI